MVGKEYLAGRGCSTESCCLLVRCLTMFFERWAVNWEVATASATTLETIDLVPVGIDRALAAYSRFEMTTDQ